MKRLLTIGLALAAVMAGAAASEGLLRAAGYRYSPLKIGSNVSSDWREQHAFHDQYLVYDPVLIWRPLSSQFSPFNPQGFRGVPIDPANTSGHRIIALGDSNTFGWTVDDGANWPAQLQGLYDAAGPGTEVVNAGLWGYTSFQGLRRFNEIVRFSPDVVLVSFGGNDAHQVTVPDAEYVRRHDRIERVTRLTARLRLAQLAVAAWDRLGALGGADGPLMPRVSLDEYSAHLREIVRSGRSHGLRVVLLTRPFTGSSSDPSSWKTHAPAYNSATEDVARSEGVEAIDVYGAFRDHPEYFDDESHFGVEGNRAMARLIHARLAGSPP